MRRRGLRRSAPLGRSTATERPQEARRAPLRPVSERTQQRAAAEADAQRRDGAAFRAAIRGERCVVCGKTEAEAYDATGFGHQAHHAIRREVLRRCGLIEWLYDPRNAVCTCEEPCHRQHTSRMRRIPRSSLPLRVLEFVELLGLGSALDREYPQ